MSYAIKADRSQIYLLPPSLDEWIGPDHPARFIAEFVTQLDLTELGFTIKNNKYGRPWYDERLLLSIFLYGYFHQLYSFRKLEIATRNDLGMMWLIGCQCPDHNSLWRFWQKNQEGLKSVFQQSVLLAEKLGMLGMIFHAMDGVKIDSASSLSSAWKKSGLEQKLAAINASISEMDAQLQSEADLEGLEGYGLIEELSNANALHEQVKAKLEELRTEDKAILHPQDRDACKGKRGKMVHNAQAVADSAHQIIVSADVVADGNDFNQLTPNLEGVKDTLGEVADETIADAGYDKMAQIDQAQKNEYGVIVNDRHQRKAKEDRFHFTHFRYDPDTLELICPEGRILAKSTIVDHSNKTHKLRKFTCTHEDCPFFRQGCGGRGTKKTPGRTVKIAFEYYSSMQQQKEKRKTRLARFALSQRKAIIEPVFGQIKHNNDFKRFTVKGLDQVRAQWNLVSTVHNLRKIFRHSFLPLIREMMEQTEALLSKEPINRLRNLKTIIDCLNQRRLKKNLKALILRSNPGAFRLI